MTDQPLPQPRLTNEEAEARLTAPGALFELEHLEIRGETLPCWKNAPLGIRGLFERTAQHGDLPFLVYEGERLSYAQLRGRVIALAHRLAGEFGVAKGERVAIAMRNYPEWIIAFFAAGSIGAVVTPLNAWMTGEELAYCMTDSGAALLIADGERIERLAPFLGKLPVRHVIHVRGDFAGVPSHDFGDLEAPADMALPEIGIGFEDDATIFYTSGTTGKPKGAFGTQRNFVANLMCAGFARARDQLRRTGEWAPAPADAPKKAGMLSVPLFHVTGCHSIMAGAVYGGNKLVLMYKWDPETALRLIQDEKLTQFGGVPSMPWQVLDSPHFRDYDLSSVEAVGFGGAPASPDLVARLKAEFPSVVCTNGYGMTETSALASQNVGLDYERKPASAGRAIPICSIAAFDEHGNALPPGMVGELRIRGSNVVKGYWNKPEETAAAFIDGAVRTGDLGRVDEDGFVYVMDRAKDMLIRGGENIYCIEVEDVLYDHPDVMDAAVVGIPDRVLGEQVGAVVQVRRGATVTLIELQDHVRARLAAFKVPVKIDIQTEPLPRNPNGKIMKAPLRERFLATA